jgi:uncharacterized lipoprotein NlpE involved in copper resistance
MIVLGALSSCGSKPKTAEEPAAVDTAHNTRNSVNWAGEYNGTIPAADGPGIEVTIELFNDATFTLQYVYIERDVEPRWLSGQFAWDDDGNRITLGVDESESLPTQYLVGENTLTQLDMAGEINTGELADMYILHKKISE